MAVCVCVCVSGGSVVIVVVVVLLVGVGEVGSHDDGENKQTHSKDDGSHAPTLGLPRRPQGPSIVPLLVQPTHLWGGGDCVV